MVGVRFAVVSRSTNAVTVSRGPGTVTAVSDGDNHGDIKRIVGGGF